MGDNMEDITLFKSRASDIFIKLLLGIMSRDLSKVKPFLNDELYNKYLDVVNNDINNNLIHCYDELNVKNIEIVKEESMDGYYFVYVKLTSLYMDYYMNADTKKYVSGINNRRVEVVHEITFKKKEGVEKGNVTKCTNCGANVDLDIISKCPYCNEDLSNINYDYIMCEVSNLWEKE